MSCEFEIRLNKWLDKNPTILYNVEKLDTTSIEEIKRYLIKTNDVDFLLRIEINSICITFSLLHKNNNILCTMERCIHKNKTLSIISLFADLLTIGYLANYNENYNVAYLLPELRLDCKAEYDAIDKKIDTNDDCLKRWLKQQKYSFDSNPITELLYNYEFNYLANYKEDRAEVLTITLMGIRYANYACIVADVGGNICFYKTTQSISIDNLDEFLIKCDKAFDVVTIKSDVYQANQNNKKPIVINLIGGPGSGKSTSAYLLAGRFKELGFNCELVTEYAKDLVWSDNLKTLNNQIYVFGKQLNRITRLENKVDFIITDSPLLLSLHYDNTNTKAFKELVVECHNKFNNVNVYVHRKKKYIKSGRLQTLDEAVEIDKSLKQLYTTNKISFDYHLNLENYSIDSLIENLQQSTLKNLTRHG